MMPAIGICSGLPSLPVLRTARRLYRIGQEPVGGLPEGTNGLSFLRRRQRILASKVRDGATHVRALGCYRQLFHLVPALKQRLGQVRVYVHKPLSFGAEPVTVGLS